MSNSVLLVNLNHRHIHLLVTLHTYLTLDTGHGMVVVGVVDEGKGGLLRVKF